MNIYSFIVKIFLTHAIPAEPEICVNHIACSLPVKINGTLHQFIDRTDHEREEPERVHVFKYLLRLSPVDKIHQGFKHFLERNLYFLVDEGRVKTLFNEDAFVEICKPV